MKGYFFTIFAGKKTGPGSKDKQGFSSNGEFFRYMATSENDAIKQFRSRHKGYNIYNVTVNRTKVYQM